MLEKGLDINYQIAKKPPRYNSTNVPNDLEQNNINFRYYTFLKFLKIKSEYEKYLLKCYTNGENQTLALAVDNILKYHIYAYPSTLKSILLGKYAHLTKEKLVAEYDKLYPESKH
jgi:hypothetical protein